MSRSLESLSLSEKFRWFPTVSACFDAMLTAIRQARYSVRLEMYIYTVSPIGELFREALMEAVRRGVRVRVMIDAFGSMRLSARFWDPLVEAGGDFRWFNPLTLDRCGFRNHRKLLVCDEETAFVGGFNVSTEYQGDGVLQGWHDLGLQVRGRLAAELAASFDALFALADFRPGRFAALRKTPLQKIVSTYDGQIILSAPGLGRNFLRHSIVHDLDNAKSVSIISAYFLPTRHIRRALVRLAHRGGCVRLILAGKSDVPLTQLASRRFYAGFLRAGIEIYEYQPQILHTKLLVIDEVVYAGSANLDRRSFYINYELMLRLPNRPLASEGEAFFAAALQHCEKIDAKAWRASRSLWSRLKERWAFFILGRLDPLIARRQMKFLK
ncbi:MAG: phospholipase D-like domain-containing protein [Verrucomicrobiota bacterium]